MACWSIFARGAMVARVVELSSGIFTRVFGDVPRRLLESGLSVRPVSSSRSLSAPSMTLDGVPGRTRYAATLVEWSKLGIFLYIEMDTPKCVASLPLGGAAIDEILTFTITPEHTCFFIRV